MNGVFFTRSLSLASLLDAMGFEYSKPGISGVRESMKDRASFTFYFRADRHDGLSAFLVLKAAKDGDEIPQGDNPIDDATLQIAMSEANDKLKGWMRECESTGRNVSIRVKGEKGTALIPQNATPSERKQYAKFI